MADRNRIIIKTIDERSRIPLGHDVMKSYGWKVGDKIKLELRPDGIFIFCQRDIFTGASDELIEFNGKYISKKTIQVLAKRIGLLDWKHG